MFCLFFDLLKQKNSQIISFFTPLFLMFLQTVDDLCREKRNFFSLYLHSKNEKISAIYCLSCYFQVTDRFRQKALNSQFLCQKHAFFKPNLKKC